MPSAPPCGISTSALKLYDVLRRLGASPFGVPVIGCVHVNVLRPVLRLGRCVIRRVTTDASRGRTLYFSASFQKSACISFSLAGFLAATSSDWVQSFLRS